MGRLANLLDGAWRPCARVTSFVGLQVDNGTVIASSAGDLILTHPPVDGRL